MFPTPPPLIGDQPDVGHPLMRGMAAWYPLQEGGGRSAFSIGTDRYTGSLVNTVLDSTWYSGQPGKFLSLDASNDRVDLNASLWSSGHQTAGQPITITCRFRRSSNPASTRHIIGKWNNPYSFWWAINSSGQPLWYIYAGGTRGPATASVSCCDGDWHLIHATYDGVTLRTGVDVAGFGTVSYTGTIASSASGLSINTRSIGTSYILGADYSDVRFYSRCLSDTELTAIRDDPWAPFARRTLTALPVAAAPPAGGYSYNNFLHAQIGAC